MKKIALIIVVICITALTAKTQSIINNDVNCTSCFKTITSGSYSSALGIYTVATGNYTLAGGYRSRAQGNQSFAFGNQDTAYTENSIALGYQSGAKGLYWASQIAIGHDNDLSIQIYGSEGTIRWRQEEPNYLEVAYKDKPAMRISRGRDTFKERAESLVRIPAGHPEGYFEALANIYKTYVAALIKKRKGKALNAEDMDFPQPEAGVSGVQFIEKCVESSKKDAAWVDFKES